jgi:hypothetical protein
VKRVIAALVAGLAVVAAAGGAAGAAEGGGGVDHGNIHVDVRVVTPGSDGATWYEPGDRNAPSPLRVESTLQMEHIGGGLGGLTVPAPCSTDGLLGTPNGFVYDVVVIDNATGEVRSTTTQCIEIAVPTPGVPAALLPAPPTIAEIWKAVPLPAPALNVSPDAEGVTGLATWLWSGSVAQVPVAVTINGWTVTGVANLTGYRFETGDGDRADTTAAGTRDQPAATHVYDVKGAYTISAASVWEAEVTMTGPLLPAPVPVGMGSAVLTSSRDYPVVEVRSALVR